LFIINITVKETLSPEQHESLFIRHAQWFKHYFSAGKFVIVGPYSDRERAGVIIANIDNHHELITILGEDSYYPDLATYEVSEFFPKMIAENLHQLQEL